MAVKVSGVSEPDAEFSGTIVYSAPEPPPARQKAASPGRARTATPPTASPRSGQTRTTVDPVRRPSVEVAVMVTDPALTPVTTPDELTVAIPVLALLQLTVWPEMTAPVAVRPVAVSVFVAPTITIGFAGVTSTHPFSSGTSVETYTVKLKVTTVDGLWNFHRLFDEISFVVRIPLLPSRLPAYWMYGWPEAVKVPVPSGLARVTVPLPEVVVGPAWMKMRTPVALGVVPSVVAHGCVIRFSTDMSKANVSAAVVRLVIRVRMLTFCPLTMSARTSAGTFTASPQVTFAGLTVTWHSSAATSDGGRTVGSVATGLADRSAHAADASASTRAPAGRRSFRMVGGMGPREYGVSGMGLGLLHE